MTSTKGDSFHVFTVKFALLHDSVAYKDILVTKFD